MMMMMMMMMKMMMMQAWTCSSFTFLRLWQVGASKTWTRQVQSVILQGQARLEQNKSYLNFNLSIIVFNHEIGQVVLIFVYEIVRAIITFEIDRTHPPD